MEKEVIQNNIRKQAGWLMMAVAGCLSVSCSDIADSVFLTEGKYPMAFTAEVNEVVATRAIDTNVWDGNELVTVKVDGVADVKPYTVAPDGTLTVGTDIDPFYWNNNIETVSGWCYGDNIYRDILPEATGGWQIQAEQNSNSGKGYLQSDFLYAPAKAVTFNDAGKELAFYHQTACVVINIKKDESAMSIDRVANVVIGNADNIALRGRFIPPVGGATAGTWDISGAIQGTIVPKEVAPGSNYQKSYAALVLPQKMSAKANNRFIAITLTDGNTYYYIPANGDADLEAGKRYVYDVTIKYGYLEVEPNTGGMWNNGGNEPITGISLKPGDYYYSDGTWSDGGYREYTDNSSAILQVMPDTKSDTRTVVGIVYYIRDSSSPEDAGGYDEFTGMPTAYVLSLDERTSKWCDATNDNLQSSKQIINGYYATYKEQMNIAIEASKAPAMSWCKGKTKVGNISAEPSKWYMISYREMYLLTDYITVIQKNLANAGGTELQNTLYHTANRMGSRGNYVHMLNPLNISEMAGSYNDHVDKVCPYRAAFAIQVNKQE